MLSHSEVLWTITGYRRIPTDDDEAEEIHLGTLEVLKDTGVFVESQEARDIFSVYF